MFVWVRQHKKSRTVVVNDAEKGQERMKKLLILDVDETLVHGALQPLARSPDHVCDWCYIYQRPHVETFMDFCRQHFRVAIWSSASVGHIRVCLDQICRSDYPFEFL